MNYTSREISYALDDEASYRVAIARLLVCIPMLGYVVSVLATRSLRSIYSLVALLCILVTYYIGNIVTYIVFIESVQRHKNGKNKELYRRDKLYFDQRGLWILIYLQLGQANLARTLDKRGRNKAVAANLLPLLTTVACILFWFLSGKVGVLWVLLGIGLIVVSLAFGVRLQTQAIVESVYRCKDGKNKKIYKEHKTYFNEKFRELSLSDRPRIKRHISKGGENGDRR